MKEMLLNRNRCIEICLLIMDALLAVFMVFRAFMGIGLQDEAYYISNALEQINGNYPIAYNNYMWTTGGGFLMIPLLWLYKTINPSISGIFLFARICFVLFRLFIIAIVYRIIRKETSKAKALIIVSVLIPNSLPQCIQMFSYNTVSFWLSLLIAFVIYDIFHNNLNCAEIKFFIVGFLSGIMVFSHPVSGIEIIYFLLLIGQSSNREKRWRNISIYCLGGIGEILVVIVPIAIKTSWHEVVNGFRELLFFNSNYGYGSAYAKVSWMHRLAESGRIIWGFLPLFVVVFLVTMWFSNKYIRENESKLEGDGLLLFTFGVSMFICQIVALNRDRRDYLSYFGLISFLVIVALLIFNKQNHFRLYCMAIYPIIFTFSEITVTNSGDTLERFSFCSIIIMTILWLLLEKNKSLLSLVAVLIAMVTVLGTCYHNFKIIHYDDFVSKLTTRVESGVFKGIYTTKERAKVFPQIEEYFNSYVDEKDTYAVRDQVPWGALLIHNGMFVDSCTWDYLDYGAGNNNPNAAYHYYQMRGEFPTKVIYVDWHIWGMEKLSIETPDFLYNKWINTYYELVGEKNFGPVNDKNGEMVNFRVKVYSYKGRFDGNFQKLIEEASLNPLMIK